MVRLSFETFIVRIYSFYISFRNFSRNFYTAKRNETKRKGEFWPRDSFGLYSAARSESECSV